MLHYVFYYVVTQHYVYTISWHQPEPPTVAIAPEISCKTSYIENLNMYLSYISICTMSVLNAQKVAFKTQLNTAQFCKFVTAIISGGGD